MVSHRLPQATSDPTGPARRRLDVQGLRGLAILAVVAYHAGVPGISGGFVGVDFFFVLSGFLITGLLVDEHARTGRIVLRDFWARRARRLLPAGATVLVAVAVASAVWIPLLDRRDVATDIRWAALFIGNWRFAAQRTDYLAQDRAPSPVLHFWSLGVEEQFYLAWPLVVATAGFVVVRMVGRTSPERRYALILGTTAGVITATSLWYCVHETTVSQPVAFFGTPARAWQLGIGALLAAGLPALRLGGRVRVALSSAGLVGYALALATLSENGAAYPGLLALVPTLSAAALIAGGSGTGRTLLDRALSTRALVFVGDRSYSWYLWHWPFLVILPLAVGSHGRRWTALAVVLSFGAAWLSFRFVEQPLRRARTLVGRPGRSLALGAALVAVVFAPAAVLAGATTDGHVRTTAGRSVVLHPNPVDAAKDVFSMRDRGCDLDYDESTIDAPCLFGDTTGSKTVVLVGDSHAVAVYPGLDVAARANGWRLYSWTKSACPTADVSRVDRVVGGPFTACDTFRTRIRDRIIDLDPDLVVTAMAYDPAATILDRATGRRVAAGDVRAETVRGLTRTIDRYTSAGIPVVVVQDLPRASTNPAECLVERKDAARCTVAVPRDDRIEAPAAAGNDGVTLFDLRDGVCTARRCSPVRGDVLVYRDTNHITRTYALTLAPRFATVLRAH